MLRVRWTNQPTDYWQTDHLQTVQNKDCSRTEANWNDHFIYILLINIHTT